MSKRISYPGVALPCPSCDRLVTGSIWQGYSDVDDVHYVESGCPFCGTLFVITASIRALPAIKRKYAYNAYGTNVTDFSMRNHGVETRLPRDFYEADRVEVMELLAALANGSRPFTELQNEARAILRKHKQRRAHITLTT